MTNKLIPKTDNQKLIMLGYKAWLKVAKSKSLKSTKKYMGENK